MPDPGRTEGCGLGRMAVLVALAALALLSLAMGLGTMGAGRG
jgi:hypothetical protein